MKRYRYINEKTGEEVIGLRNDNEMVLIDGEVYSEYYKMDDTIYIRLEKFGERYIREDFL